MIRLTRRDFLLFAAAAAATGSAWPAGLIAGRRYKARVQVGTGKKRINPAILGVDLMYPPFDSISSYLNVFRGSSVRVWSRSDPDWWRQFASALIRMKPATILAFDDRLSAHPGAVHYDSVHRNNLLPEQRVDAVVKQIELTASRLRSIGVWPEGKLYWEIWNEPEAQTSGRWRAADMARYANDLGAALKKKNVPVKLLVPLAMWDHAWNDDLCGSLDVDLVGGLVNHYYYMEWTSLPVQNDEFLSRVGDPSILRHRIDEDVSLLERYGKGNWTLHCSEWNVHPPKFAPPFYTSRDMAVAMYAFDTIKTYIETGIASAEFFLLSAHDSHFATVSVGDAAGPVMRPTGALLALLHRHLQGNMLEARVDAPGYGYRPTNGLWTSTVPYLSSIVARNGKGQPVLFFANKNRTAFAEVEFSGVTLPAHMKLVTLTGAGRQGDLVEQVEVNAALENGTVLVPPDSIALLHTI